MSDPPSTTPGRPGLPLLVLAAAALYPLIAFGARCLQALRSPYSKDYGEGCVLALTQLLAERGTYFLPLDRYPLVHGIYPPVFLVLSWAGYEAFGPSLWFPRLLSIASTLVLVAFVVALVSHHTGQRALGAACGALVLGPWFVQSFAPLARVDMLAVALSVLGLHLATRDARPGAASLLLLVAAFFTKQSALLAPAAVLLGLLASPGLRPRLPRALALFALPLLVLLAALVLLTRGEAGRHLFTYTAAAEYDLAHMARNAGHFLLLSAPLQAFIVAALASGRSEGSGSDRRFVLVVYWALNLLALSTFAKAGAAQNYFIEPWVATVLLAGCLAGEASARRPRVASLWPWAALVALLVAFLVGRGDSRLPQPLRNPERATEYADLEAAVRATSGPILSENLSVLVLNRKPVLAEPFGLLQFSRTGHFDPARLATDCRAGLFELVVAEYRLREIPGMAECFDARYVSERQLGPYELLRRR